MIDLAIIGGGPAGYTAAQKAAKAGLATVLFEKNALGGVCLNEGCIPTKTLLYSAKLYDYARHSEKYGVSTTDASFDYAAVQKRKTKVIKKLGGGIKVSMREAGVQVVEGQAQILGWNDGKGCEGGVSGENCNNGKGGEENGSIAPDSRLICIQCGEETFEAKRLLICTGSQAAVPPIPGLERDNILTNKEILELEQIPQSLAIIGGGVIGMEFASFFNSVGCKVTVIEMLPEILGGLDSEISALLRLAYTKKGVEFHLGCKVCKMEGRKIFYQTPEGQECILEAEQVLLSVGRRANLQGYGLETLGVECERGIKVDCHMQTNIPGVYAAGDVTGFSLLAHTASREGEVAVAHMLGKDEQMSYDAIPGVVYTNPEVAGVGLTEEQAAAKGLEIKVVKLPMQYSGRFVAENEAGEGICKMIACAQTGKLLGVHMMGNPCSEILGSACLAVSQGMSAEELGAIIFPHPSITEILKETAQALK